MEITLYTTTTCAPCRVVAGRLTRAGISFQKVVLDLPEHGEALAALKARLGADVLHTPTLEVDGEVVMQGLDPAEVARVIEAAK